MESGFSTLKSELGKRFESSAAAKEQRFDHIEAFSNQRRPYSTIGYVSPTECEWAARRMRRSQLVCETGHSPARGPAEAPRRSGHSPAPRQAAYCAHCLGLELSERGQRAQGCEALNVLRNPLDPDPDIPREPSLMTPRLAGRMSQGLMKSSLWIWKTFQARQTGECNIRDVRTVRRKGDGLGIHQQPRLHHPNRHDRYRRGCASSLRRSVDLCAPNVARHPLCVTMNKQDVTWERLESPTNAVRKVTRPRLSLGETGSNLAVLFACCLSNGPVDHVCQRAITWPIGDQRVLDSEHSRLRSVPEVELTLVRKERADHAGRQHGAGPGELHPPTPSRHTRHGDTATVPIA